MDNGDPRFPYPRFLRVPCVMVPKGSPPPLEWMAAHPNYVTISGFLIPPLPPEPDVELGPQPGAEGQAEASPDVPTYLVEIDYAGNWIARPVTPLTPRPAPRPELPPGRPQEPEPGQRQSPPTQADPPAGPMLYPQQTGPRPDHLRRVPPPEPRRAERPPDFRPGLALSRGMNIGMDLCTPEGTRNLMRQTTRIMADMERFSGPVTYPTIHTPETLSAAVSAGMQHLAAQKGDVHAAIASAKATGARWTDSVTEVAAPASKAVAKAAVHHEPAAAPNQQHPQAEQPSEPRAVWHGSVSTLPHHGSAPDSAGRLVQSSIDLAGTVGRFVSNHPFAALIVLGTEIIGGGPEDPAADGAAGTEIALAEGTAKTGAKKAAKFAAAAVATKVAEVAAQAAAKAEAEHAAEVSAKKAAEHAAETAAKDTTSAARNGPTTAERLTAAADRAASTIGQGRGSVYGTIVHKAFSNEVVNLGDSNIASEVSYLNGDPVPYGTPGSVRLDVVEGPPDAPTAVYDLKTGRATLSPRRTAQIQKHIPNGTDVPVVRITVP